MNKDTAIDEVFKDGLSDMTFSNREALWEKMENELDSKKRKKKRFAFILLLCCLITGGFFAAKNINQNRKALAENIPPYQQKKKGDVKATNNIVAAADIMQHPINPVPTGVSATNTQSVSSGKIKGPAKGSVRARTSFDVGENMDAALTARTATDNLKHSAAPVMTGVSAINKQTTSSRKINKTTKGAVSAGTSFDVDENTDAAFTAERVAADFNVLPYASTYKSTNNIPQHQTAVTVVKAITKTPEIKLKKISLEIVAGSDIFNLNKKIGYYGGLRVSRNLDKGTSISVGINYSFNTLNEKYRLSNKPLQQQETDAQINSLKMLRFPVFFQRQLSTTKFALMAGLIPSYILDASVYNVPNSNTGNPALYRKFVLNDINRFNILFGAGIKYAAFRNIAFELSGSYGFTELVKDSYINQSNVNDNFKNIQAGVVFRLK